MKNRLQELEDIQLDYELQKTTLKLLETEFKKAQKGNQVSKQILNSEFSNETLPALQTRMESVKQRIDDSAIFSMWVVFERTLVEYIIKIIVLPSSVGTTASTDIQNAVSEKIRKEVDWWKVEDKLDLVKPLLTSNVVGKLKQIKKYRDWIAHRSSTSAPSKTNPNDIYRTLKDIIPLIS
jgi:hypothetical protein